MAASKKSRASAFVPRMLVRGVMVSVIPACAVVACGGTEGPTADAGVGDASVDRFPLGVAAVAYPAYESGAPDATGADGSPRDSATGADVFLGVAAVAYPAYESGVPDATTDGAVRDATGPDVFLGVAAVAYPAYEAGKG